MGAWKYHLGHTAGCPRCQPMPQRNRGGQHVQQQPTMHASPIRLPNGTLAWTPRACGQNPCQSYCAQSPSETYTTYNLFSILYPVFLARPLPGLSGPLQNTCQCCSLADCWPIGGKFGSRPLVCSFPGQLHYKASMLDMEVMAQGMSQLAGGSLSRFSC
jgi:hypothetical protein